MHACRRCTTSMTQRSAVARRRGARRARSPGPSLSGPRAAACCPCTVLAAKRGRARLATSQLSYGLDGSVAARVPGRWF